MRMKLETEYTQNTKNHEEEVQLRLQFEAKLNKMHGQNRDLNGRFTRAATDLENTLKQKTDIEKELTIKIDENTLLNQKLVDQNSRTNSQVEKIQSLQREIGIKST